ncbi:MAG: ABC transporter permease [Gemmatimonadota bacterium]|nr:ABC transporter permease [Gemmatimonadota bacterium]
MRFWEGIRLALQQIWAQKLKSFFSLVGVIIGITFLIAVITIVEGMNTYVREDFAGSLFGVNTFSVVRRAQINTGSIDQAERRRTARNPDLLLRDVAVVEEAAPTAKYVAYSADRGFPEVRYGSNSRRNIRVIGGSEDYQAVQGWEVEEGRGLTAIDEQRALKVAVIGAQIAERLFPTNSPLEKRIRVGGQRFRVIGVLERQGGFIGNVRDASILIPFSTFNATLSRRRNGVDEIHVKVETESQMEPTMASVEGALRRDRGLRPTEENDFHLQTSNDLLSAWNTINAILLAAIPGLVSVSLVVGGIVIMNIMLLSVSDRTREIGLRKSLGAKRRDILFQFLTEASTLSIVGSVLGIGIGLGLAALVDRFSPLPATVSLPWLLLAIVLGMGVGVSSGIYPAYRASKLDPIEALRSE